MDNNYVQNQQVNQEQQVIQVNQQQNVNEQVESTIFDKHMQMNEQYVNDRKRNGEEDSGEMQQVKSKLSEISSVLGAQMSEDEHDFRLQITVLKDHYNELLLACDTYLATKKWAKYALFGEAKRRRNMVIAIKKMAQNEADCLSGLSKDKELHIMRVEGMLVGNALSSALRDYQAVKEDIDFSILRLEGQDYVRSISNDATALRDNVIVNREAGKMTTDMKNVVCTNRLAKFIGMDGICSRSTLVMSKDEEQKYHYGLKNEGQPDYHQTLAEIKIAQGRHPYKISYSGEALKQISNARLFHMLLGGNSLKAENDLVMIYSKTQMGEETTYHITGVYLDTNKEKFSDDADTKSMGRLLDKGDFLMTDAMAQSILNLEPGDIEYVAGEMLSNDKKKAFAKRVNFLKNWVRAKKEEEAQTGPSRILSEEAWKEEENLEEIRDRITVAGSGFYLGILKNNSYVEETDGENKGQYEKDYQKLYKKIKRSLEDAKDIKTRIYIIGTLPELNKIYEKKYVGNEGIAKEMVDDIQSRFLSDYVNDEFIKEYYNELWRVKKELAEAYNKEITKNPNNENAAYEAVNQNRTLYRNLTILTNLSTSWLNGNALGRDLRMNKLGQYVLDVGQKHKKNLAREAAEKEIGAQNQDDKVVKKSEIQEKYNKISEDQKKDADTVDLIISKFQNLENGNHSKVFDEQIDYWLEKDFLKNPIVWLGKKFLPKKNQKPSMFGK